ncbi:uncharacterized protein BCR38DRAFT_206900 [Pseudomassariella vexata]|uniref:Uncharacterized protein n=1 Tax=Pseudomassariella vexata TaxID=1141098 RepID=A0A1Y2DY04_9PEZI|nr:uncharacterized protein BCR38DRAFT_206900 [Pseudomassariella vexata]ORY64117.1 hypothetical protein BCR38DRAFT_206900 [Pseudomassariella vexata]
MFDTSCLQLDGRVPCKQAEQWETSICGLMQRNPLFSARGVMIGRLWVWVCDYLIKTASDASYWRSKQQELRVSHAFFHGTIDEGLAPHQVGPSALVKSAIGLKSTNGPPLPLVKPRQPVKRLVQGQGRQAMPRKVMVLDCREWLRRASRLLRVVRWH